MDVTTAAARSSAVEDLLNAVDQIKKRYRGDGPEADLHRGADAERITGELTRHLTIARVRLASTTLPPDRDRSFTSAPEDPG